jgi:hypothetical protein
MPGHDRCDLEEPLIRSPVEATRPFEIAMRAQVGYGQRGDKGDRDHGNSVVEAKYLDHGRFEIQRKLFRRLSEYRN